MARPTKAETEKRGSRLEVMVTGSGRAEIAARADALGLPLSAYMRSVALGVEPPARKAGVDAEAVAALNRVGSNLNQLAKIGNKSGTLNAGQIKALGAVLSQVKQTAGKIGEAIA